MAETFTAKLGTTRRGPRSRIWLEGKRLTAAGFTPGQQYTAIWTDNALLLMVGVGSLPARVTHAEERKVSGKGDKPIMDIVGERVTSTFGHGERVKVTYSAGLIRITGEAA